MTPSGRVKPLDAFCLHPMSDFAMCNKLLVAHLSHAMSPFGLKLVECLMLSYEIRVNPMM
jgi:hypothetical protein